MNGAIYADTSKFLRKYRVLMSPERITSLHQIDRLRGLDIDDPDDLLLFK